MAEVLALLDAPGVEDDFKTALRTAINAVREALHVYHRQGELVFSFNGGKDSTVVLHVIRAAVHEHISSRGKAHDSNDSTKGAGAECSQSPLEADQRPLLGCIPVVYFESADNFPEVLAFMDDTAKQYGFSVRRLPGFKAGLEALVSEGVRGVLMGTRSTDPDGGKLSHFTPTSLNWPPCMRICPALLWGYGHVWDLLRGAGLPYCVLYDRGYTSLGSTRDSVPNPRLLATAASPLRASAEGSADAGNGLAIVVPASQSQFTSSQASGEPPAFLPAWMLSDGAAERLGRSNARKALPASPPTVPPVNGVSPAAPMAAIPPTCAPVPQQPTSAVVVIGDELLSGRVADANGRFLCDHLTRTCGLRVDEVAVVPDDVAAISAAVTRLRQRHACVVTTGGLGPTHDDVTLAGVAAAFGYPTRRCGAMARLLRALGRRHAAACPPQAGAVGADGSPSAPATAPSHPADGGAESYRLRMADLPCGPAVRLHYADGTTAPFDVSDSVGDAAVLQRLQAGAAGSTETGSIEVDDVAAIARGYPLLSVGNVYVLPGVPSILKRKWGAHMGLFTVLGGVPPSCATLTVSADEASIAGALETIAARYEGRVKLGSYPVDSGSGTPTVTAGGPSPLVSVEFTGVDAAAVAQARAELVAALEKASVAIY